MPHTSTELERRVQLLERRVRSLQLTSLALLVVAVVAVGATRAMSQSPARELTLSTLNIVGSDGKLRAVLSGDARLNPGGGSLALVDAGGTVRLGLMAARDGGSVSVFDGASRPMAMLGSSGDQGTLALGSARSKARVSVGVTPKISGVVVEGPTGAQAFVAGADETGGLARAFDAQGRLKGQLPAR